MITCPSCSHENVDGTTFCEICGEELQAAPTASAASTPAADAGDASGDITCPACENLNPRENVVCEVCGTELHPAGGDAAAVSVPAADVVGDADDTSTPPAAPVDEGDSAGVITTDAAPPIPPDTTPATAPAAADDDASTPAPAGAALVPGQVKLVVEQGMNVGKQFVLGDAEMQVGREDEDEEIYPDIDLADQDEGYVHRKHATLKFENDQLFVTHLGGANKTRLNNKPVPDDVPQPVKLGDKIAFGKVVLRVLPHS
jgi:pSer/pThr/pTyr-binding forkhead associated (FHA) protein